MIRRKINNINPLLSNCENDWIEEEFKREMYETNNVIKEVTPKSHPKMTG